MKKLRLSVVGFYLFVGISLFFLIIGLLVNPSIQDIFAQPPSPMQSPITGQKSFNFPDILTGFNLSITLFYNVTSPAFVENSPVFIALEWTYQI